MSRTAEALALVRPQPAPAAAVPTSRYATLMTHAEPGMQATQRIEFAARLACELDAHLVGVVARCLTPFMVADPASGYPPAERISGLARGLEAEVIDAEVSFQRDAAGSDCEVRVVEDFPAAALAQAARAADLIILSPRAKAPTYQKPDPGEVAVCAGKPVLIVPTHAHRVTFDTIVLAWKDNRECRRATAAALPFQQRARKVIVRGVCDDDRDAVVGAQLAEVVESLRRQGVAAESEIGAAVDGIAHTLIKALSRHDADLLVMGAYGHARATELVFGGVTQQFLRQPPCCVLMAH